MFGRRLFSYFLSRKICQIKVIFSEFRFIHGIIHNPKREIFYVKLQDSERAVLTYKNDGQIMDFRTISVPKNHQGEGLAQRLTEAAFTYAIVNNYHMYLTCVYIQKYYLATKNPDLEELIVGPPNVLEGPYSETPNPNAVYEIPEPEEFMISPPEN